MLENIEVEHVQFVLARDFFAELRKEFKEGDNKLAKVSKLKKIEQREKIMK